jgi:arylsulfatase A-like enzyme
MSWLATGLALWVAGAAVPAVAAAPAYVLIMIADDQGWADVPWRGSPARMTSLDQLRQSGEELMRFYSAPVCSPIRSALYTRPSAMQHGIRDPFTAQDPGLSLLEQLIPETFRAAGYETALIGKWHLGSTKAARLPNARGFDHFYGFLGGAVSYNTRLGLSARVRCRSAADSEPRAWRGRCRESRQNGAKFLCLIPPISERGGIWVASNKLSSATR